jgi:DNA-binding SARP family transcriptional activator
MLRVQLLGEVNGARDGEPVPLSAPHRRLLAFLALHPGPHDRDVLAARFWPDASAARANLRTAVWALRRSLGADAVLASRTTVALAPAHRDVDELEELVRECDTSTLAAGPCAGLDDDWAQAARVEHRRRCPLVGSTLRADPARRARPPGSPRTTCRGG